MRILIIDDDHGLTQILSLVINQIGHKTKVAETQVDAEFWLNNPTEFDVILLDLQGGDIDREKIMGTAQAINKPVIRMSGEPKLKPRLNKPFDMPELERALSEVVKE